MTLNLTVENLAAANGVAVAPLNIGFHGGGFDGFDLGSVASASLQAAAELGDGSGWRADLAAADPGATVGAVGGVLLPGTLASAQFEVDPLANPAAVLATIIIGAVMSLFWFLVNRRQQDEMKTAVMLVRDQLPGYTAYVKARSNSGLRKFGPAVFIYGIPIAVTFIWVVFAAERLFVWLNL